MARTTRIIIINFPCDAVGVTATVAVEIDRHEARDCRGRWTIVPERALHSDAVADCRGLSRFGGMSFPLRNGDAIASMTDVLAICEREYAYWADCSQRALPMSRSMRGEPSISEQAEFRYSA